MRANYPIRARSDACSGIFEAITPTGENDYTLVDTRTLEFKILLNSNEQILDLLSMTPHLFRASSEGKSCIENMESLSLTTDIIFRVFEYNA